jgi:hypothetical protein
MSRQLILDHSKQVNRADVAYRRMSRTLNPHRLGMPQTTSGIDAGGTRMATAITVEMNRLNRMSDSRTTIDAAPKNATIYARAPWVKVSSSQFAELRPSYGRTVAWRQADFFNGLIRRGNKSSCHRNLPHSLTGTLLQILKNAIPTSSCHAAHFTYCAAPTAGTAVDFSFISNAGLLFQSWSTMSVDLTMGTGENSRRLLSTLVRNPRRSSLSARDNNT